MKTEERVAFVFGDDTFAVFAVDDVPHSFLRRVKWSNGVKYVLLPHDLRTTPRILTIPNTQNEVVLRDERGVQVSSGCICNSRQNICPSHISRHAEDLVCPLSAKGKVLVQDESPVTGSDLA